MVARFHWPTTLFAMKAFRAAQLETYAPVARNVPMYRTVTCVDDGRPNMRNPAMRQRALKAMRGPRMRSLSPTKEVKMTGMTAQ